MRYPNNTIVVAQFTGDEEQMHLYPIRTEEDEKYRQLAHAACRKSHIFLRERIDHWLLITSTCPDKDFLKLSPISQIQSSWDDRFYLFIKAQNRQLDELLSHLITSYNP